MHPKSFVSNFWGAVHIRYRGCCFFLKNCTIQPMRSPSDASTPEPTFLRHTFWNSINIQRK